MLFVERRGEVSALPKVAVPAVLVISTLCVSHMQVSQGVPNRPLVVRDEHEMHMIGHEAVGKNFGVVSLDVEMQPGEIRLIVSVGKEHLAPAIATLGDVMGHPRTDQTSNTRHFGTLGDPELWDASEFHRLIA